MNTKARDVKIEFFKSSGPGGQHKNKRFSAVKATHIPTGITAVASEERSQFKNRQAALKRLAQKVAKAKKKKKKRIRVSIPRAVKERILESKKRRGEKKRSRRQVRQDDW
ncbi:peptide chain release factor-like protein [Thermoproteota archaeon]